ncbi:hypothetical protein JTE90_000179 [Oedothorax gibbosus]|uniref:Uncharacterized protein n=1 Tax=Oedothorax gibbosus TaxID=931172 RepID=A0AAV6UV39_9ARAC|nr:hypothetical protein JTE90_000179 [Oedothorax gibbosus]
MNLILLYLIIFIYIAGEFVSCKHLPTLHPDHPLQKRNSSDSSVKDKIYGAHNLEQLRKRSIMVYYTFATLGILTILGILLYFSSISEQECLAKKTSQVKYTAPMKKVLKSNEESFLPRSYKAPTKCSGEEEYWWDEDQELYSCGTLPQDIDLLKV